jgi:hypothetical protein
LAKINKNFSYCSKKKGRFVMKAKYYLGIIPILLISASSLKAQSNDHYNYRNGDATVVVNNYHGDYDYYYSSRINRFHRSYSSFKYYAPVFTETYWYNYQPNTWGVSIYSGGGLGISYSAGYSSYGYDYGYYGGWNEPYYSNSFYWGYAPVYYSYWYSPVVINMQVGYSWPGHYYGGHANVHNHDNYSDYYRPVNKSDNYSYSSSHKSVNNTSGGETRRYLDPSKDLKITDNSNNWNNGNNDSNINSNNNNRNSGNNGNNGKAGAGGGKGSSVSSGTGSARSYGSAPKSTSTGRSGTSGTTKKSSSKSESKSSGSSTSKEKSTQRR